MAYLKSIVGFSSHILPPAPPFLFRTAICTSSMSSTAAMGMPWRIIFETHVTALRTDGNVATATLWVSGTGASFSVTSVIIPSVPSEPANRPVRLYPAEVFLDPVSINDVRGTQHHLPRSLPGFDNGPISQNNREVYDPVLHCAVPDCVCSTRR